jgi:hypothetical protein
MAQVTRLWPYGGPGHQYGSFAGKAEQVVVPSVTRRARGGPWIRWADDEPPKHKTLRQIVNEMFDEKPIAEVYEDLTETSTASAKRAAAIVAPRMSEAEVTPIMIDWNKIQRNEKKVAQLRKLWVDVQLRHVAEMRDEEWFML